MPQVPMVQVAPSATQVAAAVSQHAVPEQLSPAQQA